MNRWRWFFTWSVAVFLGITLNKGTCLFNGGDAYAEAASGGAQVIAEEGEDVHKAPHGGQVKTVGDKHVEFVFHRHNKGYMLQIYLLDAHENTLPVTGIDCIVYLPLIEGAKSVIPLIKQVNPGEPSYFEASVEEISLQDKVVVSMTIDGQRHNLRYDVPSEGKVEHPDEEIKHHD